MTALKRILKIFYIQNWVVVVMQKWVMRQLLCYWREFCTWRSCRREFYFSFALGDLAGRNFILVKLAGKWAFFSLRNWNSKWSSSISPDKCAPVCNLWNFHTCNPVHTEKWKPRTEPRYTTFPSPFAFGIPGFCSHHFTVQFKCPLQDLVFWFRWKGYIFNGTSFPIRLSKLNTISSEPNF